MQKILIKITINSLSNFVLSQLSILMVNWYAQIPYSLHSWLIMIKMVIFSGYGSEWKFQFPFGPEQEGRVTQQEIIQGQV